MNISPQGLALIKRFEGFSAHAYLCPAGKSTIGFGHVIPPQGGIRTPSFSGVTMQEAEKLLLSDLKPVEAAINRLVSVPLSQNQFDALCSLIYNIGTGAFAKSTLLKLLNRHSRVGGNLSILPTNGERDPRLRGDDEIAAQFPRWIYGGGHILPGLVARRKAEMELFEKQ